MKNDYEKVFSYNVVEDYRIQILSKFHEFWNKYAHDMLKEVDRLDIPYFWKTENLFYVVASMDRNLKGSKKSVQHEK